MYSFSGPDGESPSSNLVQDIWGNLYGTTLYGGSASAGVLFKIDRQGHEQVLHNFTGGSDGGRPGDLVFDTFGNLYGTTAAAGCFGGDICGLFGGCGTVYKLDRSGGFSTIHTFQGDDDGSIPYGRLLFANGNLYGTTFLGGAVYLFGSIFKMATTGKETPLYFFTGSSDGGNPYGGLRLPRQSLRDDRLWRVGLWSRLQTANATHWLEVCK